MANRSTNCPGALRFDEIGYWSEIKLDIVRKYAAAYTRILSRRAFRTTYIDAFAGSGVHVAKGTGKLVPGSPLNALQIDPPFDRHVLIDLDGDKVDQLRSFPEVQKRADVTVIHGDCNRMLLDDVFPHVRHEDYRRALCVLDPYGLHLNWDVIEMAGKMRSIDVFLNFPIMDMNRSALWHKPEKITREGRARMTAFWGDDSWKTAAYRQEATLFGDVDDVKRGNEEVAEGFRARLISVAGFEYVPDPLPMRNSMNSVVYYLFFASHQPVGAEKIVRDVFNKYRTWRG